MAQQGAGCGKGIGAAAADGCHVVVGLEHVPVTGEQQDMLTVRNKEHGFQTAQIFVLAPFLGQFHSGTLQVAAKFLELGFEQLKQGEGIGRGTGKTGHDLAVIQAAHLAGGMLHDHGLAQGDLAVPGHSNLSVLLDCQNRRRVRFYHRSSQISLRSLYTASSLRKAALSADFSVFALACLK